MRLMVHFARSYPWQTLMMLLALMAAGISEGAGLTALLPLLQIAIDNGHAADASSVSGSNETMLNILAFIGVQPTVESLLIIIMAGVLLKSALMLLANRKVGYTVAHVATDLRLALLRSLLGARWEYFLNQKVGSLANAAASEVMRASSAYLFGATAAAFFIQAIVYSLVALTINWQATLVALGASSLVLMMLNWLVRTTKRAGRKQTQLLQSLLARLTDSLHSVKPLKAMGRENLADALLQSDTHKLNKALRKQVFSKAALKGVQEPVLTLLVVIGLYLSLVSWKIELTTVMVLTFLLVRVLVQLSKVQRQYQEMQACESAYWSLNEKICSAEAEKEVSTGTRDVQLEAQISLEHVHFSYGEIPILFDMSLQVVAGTFTSIVGPSGAGKTTLVDLVTGLLRPQQGEILLDGVSLDDIDLVKWRRQIGYVPQDIMLLHDSIRTNITLGDDSLTDQDVEDALRAAGVWDFVKALPEGIYNTVGERGTKVSGGQRQRIAIARALAHRPRLLILDEATSALDPESEMAICRTMRELRGQLTILSISHRPALVEAADQVYQLENGRVVKLTSRREPKES
jgi:ATP-binding cassette subfamily C protein